MSIFYAMIPEWVKIATVAALLSTLTYTGVSNHFTIASLERDNSKLRLEIKREKLLNIRVGTTSVLNDITDRRQDAKDRITGDANTTDVNDYSWMQLQRPGYAW